MNWITLFGSFICQVLFALNYVALICRFWRATYDESCIGNFFRACMDLHIGVHIGVMGVGIFLFKSAMEKDFQNVIDANLNQSERFVAFARLCEWCRIVLFPLWFLVPGFVFHIATDRQIGFWFSATMFLYFHVLATMAV